MTDLIASDLNADEKNSWGTDPLIFEAMNAEFDFQIDAAANFNNRKCSIFYSKENSALDHDWSERLATRRNMNVWVNPPYGRGFIQKFMEKAVEQKGKGVTTVMLVPATLDAQWLPIDEISEIRIVTGGRLSFMHPATGKKIAGNTKGSMFVVFAPCSSPLVTRYIKRDELVQKGQLALIKKSKAA